MPIPESQLATWSNYHGTQKAIATHKVIRSTIEQGLDRIVDTYLQGSYRNHTNTWGKSDVDIVAELRSTFYYDIEQLSYREQQEFRASNGDSDYGWLEFRSDVIRVLTDRFGHQVDTTKKRCIEIDGSSDRMAADVVAAVEYRIYASFNSQTGGEYISGMRFLDLGTMQWVENFPKLHYENGATKNALHNTRQNYKPTIRMFKNARDKLINDGYLSTDLAPSYFVECLLYNVPDSCFLGTYREMYVQVLEWLEKQVEDDTLEDFCCQHGLGKLFGFSFVQWSDYKAISFIQQLRNLWDNW